MTAVASPRDKTAVMDLFCRIFPDGESGFNRRFFEKVWRPENTLMVSSENQLVSMLQHWTVQTALGPCSYIYGVATREDFRGKGLAAGLLQNVPLPHILICEGPEVFGFYKKLGYDVSFFVSEGRGEALGRKMYPEDLPRVLEIYRESQPFLHRDLNHLKLCLEFYGGRVFQAQGRITSYSFGSLEAMGQNPEKTAVSFLCPGTDLPFGCSKGLDAAGPLYISLLYN